MFENISFHHFYGRARKPAASGRVFLPSDSNRNSFAYIFKAKISTVTYLHASYSYIFDVYGSGDPPFTRSRSGQRESGATCDSMKTLYISHLNQVGN
jgi:hypothetical protein